MNRFQIDLTGKKGIYAKGQFCRAGATKPSRTFTFEGGPGLNPTGGAGCLGLAFGAYTVSGRWDADQMRDTLDVRAFEAYLDAEGREVEPVETSEAVQVDVARPRAGKEAPPVVETPAEPVAAKEAKPKAAKAAKVSAPAPTDGDLRPVYDAVRAAMNADKTTCAKGHDITFENANSADLRRQQKYRCLPCIRGYAR